MNPSTSIQLLIGWEPFDATYDRPVRATRKDGFIYLSGIIKNSSTTVYDNATPIFQLPKH